MLVFSEDLRYIATISYYLAFFSTFIFVDGAPVMATGSTQGHLSIWDLENRKLHSCLRDCHNGSVAGMKFLLNKPLLITSGSDNSLKVKPSGISFCHL